MSVRSHWLRRLKKIMEGEEVVPVPSVNFYIHIKKMLKYTPDLAKLREKPAHFMFFVDDLKRGHRRHEMLKGAEFFATAFSRSGYSMWKHNLGKETFPIPFEDSDAVVPFSKVKGELYLVPTDMIKILDEHRQNGVQFIRKRVRLAIPFRTVRMDKDAKVVYTSRTREQYWSAWMYVGINDYWVELLNGVQFGTVSQQHFGVEGNSMKYYEFVYQDYFDEEVKVVSRKLIPLPKLDAYGNEIVEPPAPPPVPEVKPTWWQIIELKARKK